jgi:hypothetical protein
MLDAWCGGGGTRRLRTRRWRAAGPALTTGSFESDGRAKAAGGRQKKMIPPTAPELLFARPPPWLFERVWSYSTVSVSASVTA